MYRQLIVCIAFVGLASATVDLREAQAKALAATTHGKIDLKSVDVIGFGPDGVLLIGDGRAAAIYAVQTQPVKSQGPITANTANIAAKLGAAIGAPADGIEILDLAVNPTTDEAYFAVRKQDDKTALVLTYNAAGNVGLFDLDSVDYVRVALPTGGAAISKITDVAWADEKLIAAAGASEEFASKIFVVPAPLKPDSVGELYSAETFHVAHNKWETKAPMSTIMPFQEEGKTYLAGAFACTPVVKYPLDSLSAGAHVKGMSVLELGSGNRPLDMFTYEKDGKQFVLANTLRFHHEKRPFGPSPYWTVKFERELLGEKEAVNEKALWRIGKDYQPATDRVQMIEAFHGVTQMDRLGDDKALVLRQNADKSLELAVLALP